MLNKVEYYLAYNDKLLTLFAKFNYCNGAKLMSGYYSDSNRWKQGKIGMQPITNKMDIRVSGLKLSWRKQNLLLKSMLENTCWRIPNTNAIKITGDNTKFTVQIEKTRKKS